MKPAPLFVTGTARSGSTLLAYLLSAHPQIRVASDPCFPLFRALRAAQLRVRTEADSPLRRYTSLPLQDYYFTDERLRVLDLVLASGLEAPVPADDWAALRPALAERSRHESPDLTSFL